MICNYGGVNQWEVLSMKNCSYLRINPISFPDQLKLMGFLLASLWRQTYLHGTVLWFCVHSRAKGHPLKNLDSQQSEKY